MEVTSEEINENDGIYMHVLYSTIARMKENKQKRKENEGEQFFC
jgi:hypothetical protein